MKKVLVVLALVSWNVGAFKVSNASSELVGIFYNGKGGEVGPGEKSVDFAFKKSATLKATYNDKALKYKPSKEFVDNLKKSPESYLMVNISYYYVDYELTNTPKLFSLERITPTKHEIIMDGEVVGLTDDQEVKVLDSINL